jgi:hypothetical protein
MNTFAVIDLSGLNSQFQALQDALIGAGQDGDLQTIVKDEGRLLSWEISKQLGPQEKARGEAKVYQDAKRTYAPGPLQAFPQSKRNGASGDSGLTWLYAGPTFLVGAEMENIQPNLSATAMRKDQATNKKRITGKAWLDIGRRGKQAVLKWNRVIVTRGAFDSFVRSKEERVGRMRATFAYAAHMLGHSRIPGWISRHFQKVSTDGRAIYDASKLQNKVAPSLQFGSGAPGIDNFTDMIVNGVERRSHLMSAKIAGIIAGYSADWRSGRRITPKVKSS